VSEETPPELYATPHWYACRTRARAEKKVTQLFVGTRIECYLPVVDRERAWADRTKVVSFPLFPGYVFGRFPLTRLHDVLSTPGVVTVLRPNGYPTPVREEELASVRRLVEGARETGTVPEPADYLEPGEEVVVTEGPFEGMRGVLLEVRGRRRVAVRIEALRQATSVEVPRGVVRPAQGPRSGEAA